MLARLNRWAGLDRTSWLLALRLAFSAWLAFAIATLLQLENPFWAAMPVWVMTRASRGLMLERAFFRLAGTLLGAALGFAILAAPASMYVQLALLGAVVAVSAGLTHIVRGTHTYAPLMTGITAAVVALPALSRPELGGLLAVARVECTLIGVLTATLVMGLSAPRSGTAIFYQRLLQAAADSVQHAADTLDQPGETRFAEQARLLSTLGDLDAQARFVSVGSLNAYRHLREVDRTLMACFVVMASATALHTARKTIAFEEQALADALRTLAPCLSTDANTPAPELPDHYLPDTPPGRRLRLALATLQHARAALLSLPRENRPGETTLAIEPDRDWSMARQTGLTAALTVMLAGGIALVTGVAAAQLGAVGVSIFSMVLSAVPGPQRAAPKMVAAVVLAVAFATLYRLLVQPLPLDVPTALLGLLPFLLLGGVAKASQRFGIPAVDANICFMLASQAGKPPALASDIFAGGAALIAGALMVCSVFLWLGADAGRQTRRLLSDLLDDHHQLVTRRKTPRHEVWQAMSARKLLRLIQHVAHKGKPQDPLPQGLLSLISLGDAIITLRRLTRNIDHHAVANRALLIVRNYPSDPTRTAEALEGLKSKAGDDPQLLAVLEAATCGVRQCATLVEFSLGNGTSKQTEKLP